MASGWLNRALQCFPGRSTVLGLAFLAPLCPVRAVEAAASELAACRAWVEQSFASGLPRSDGAPVPAVVSFVYGGTNSSALFADWLQESVETPLDSQRTRRSWKCRDRVTGLEVQAEIELFRDFPAVEWVVRLTNSSLTNTPLIERLLALDAQLPLPNPGRATLHWAKGAVASLDDFAPQTSPLNVGAKRRFQPGGGRSSSDVLPFFNVECGAKGLVAGIGWSGEWGAEFSSDQQGRVHLSTGQAQTRFFLYPGETVRTPRILLLFYEGDRWRGQNLLRQFLLQHHRPRRGGAPIVAPITCGNWGGTRAEVHLDNIEQIIRHGLPIDYYWIDAEWYGQGGWPVNVGHWQLKKELYPFGFRPLSDALRPSGRELMLWFEPERVYKGTPWHQAHRDWLVDIGRENLLYDLGNPVARQFLTEFISARIEQFGLGCYRQDFNMEPLPYWRAADPPAREGITEIRYIEGLYAFWDELLRRHPGLLIDNCASGGRRIDLETIGRATPFWRTDGPRDPIAHQCHTYGLLPWVPLSATSQDRAGDDYEFRSSMCSALCLNWWVSGDVPAERIPTNFPFDWAKATLGQYLKIRDFFYGDFYPLTGYSLADDVWMAYQLDRPASQDGLLVVLRRPHSPYETVRLPLRALKADAVYRIINLATEETRTFEGRPLLQEGLPIALPRAPGSDLYLYERTP